MLRVGSELAGLGAWRAIGSRWAAMITLPRSRTRERLMQMVFDARLAARVDRSNHTRVVGLVNADETPARKQLAGQQSQQPHDAPRHRPRGDGRLPQQWPCHGRAQKNRGEHAAARVRVVYCGHRRGQIDSMAAL
jgi:hypothetical protein